MSGHDDAMAIVWSQSSCRHCRHITVVSARACGPGWDQGDGKGGVSAGRGQGAHEVGMTWGMWAMHIGKVMRVVAVVSEGMQAVVAGSSSGKEGGVEARSRLQRGPRQGTALFWLTRLLQGMYLQ